jgi:hypothetical protein
MDFGNPAAGVSTPTSVVSVADLSCHVRAGARLAGDDAPTHGSLTSILRRQAGSAVSA